MNTLTFVLSSLLFFSGVEYNNIPSFSGFYTTSAITSELEAKTGIRLRFIIDRDVRLSKNYMENIAGKNFDNDIVIILDKHNNKIYKFQGKNTVKFLKSEFFSYVLENELAGIAPGFIGNKVESAAAILANHISKNKGVPLLSLKNIYIKPVDSFFYRMTGMWPFKFIVKAFYYNFLLFLSVFPFVTWYIFVKVPKLFLGDEAEKTGKSAWKVFLFLIFCVIITRVGTDFNVLVGTIAAALVLFMPLAAIAAAVFREEIKSLTIKFFGWED